MEIIVVDVVNSEKFIAEEIARLENSRSDWYKGVSWGLCLKAMTGDLNWAVQYSKEAFRSFVG